MEDRPPLTERISFSFATTSTDTEPLSTWRQQLGTVWTSLDWLMLTRILKSDICVTIAFILNLTYWGWHDIGTGMVLSSIAIEFIHPAGSYGRIWENAAFGMIMSSVAAGWSILGTYCANAVRDHDDPTLAQPLVTLVLYIFLIIGAFWLNYARAKWEQTNVAGLFSATIMVLSLVDAVHSSEWQPRDVLVSWMAVNIGLGLVIVTNLALWPESSTHSFVLVLDDTLQQFDSIFSEHVARLLRRGPQRPPLGLTKVNGMLHASIMKVIEAKRIVRREATINRLAPADVRDITNLVKMMRISVQGVALASTMQRNMDDHLETSGHRFVRIDTFRSEHPPHFGYCDSDSTTFNDLPNEIDQNLESDLRTWSDHASFQSDIFPPEHCATRQRKGSLFDDILKSYESVIQITEPVCSDLANACSRALKGSIARLKRSQDFDPRYFNKPYFYRLFPSVRNSYNPDNENLDFDHSVPLLEAIAQFDKHRLEGLNELMRSDGKTPHRALFLVLLFQFNLRDYAEKLYTLSSLIYEIHCIRKKKRFWYRHVSIRKFLLGHKHAGVGDLGLEAPQAANDENVAILSRTRSVRNASHAPPPTACQEPTLRRGRARSFQHPKPKETETTASNPEKDPVIHNPLDAIQYRDPDAMLPSNRFEAFFHSIWLYRGLIYAPETEFALKACIVVVLLSIPAFIPSSMEWYAGSRGEWAAVTALVWMGPRVGSNLFGMIVRSAGTIVGAIMSMVIWEISRGNPYGLAVLHFVFYLPCWYVFLNVSAPGKFWRTTGQFAMITNSLILGYTYQLINSGNNVPVYVVAYERAVTVLVGVVSATILSVLPFPKNGRVELRHRMANTISQLGSMYEAFLALLLEDSRHRAQYPALHNRKLFRKLAIGIRKQIVGEQVLFEQSKYEPPLRGKFPKHTYSKMLQILDNMLNLLIEMEYSLEKIDRSWRRGLVHSTWRARRDLLAVVLTSIQLATNSLINKLPLPPTIMRPTWARMRLTEHARLCPALQISHLGDVEYLYYAAYLMNSEQFCVEIEALLDCIRELVGESNVSLWLKSNR
ncbi:hypothetical protein K450DRAFT_217274 [Umbelopsis ramanniana AG]|uniref:ER transporter 6TM N-terminal domain-containing protein n=1 Tax=Umbelopsis ramanniana AG TaxID=1314678 RepID=A0AAD5EK40_UMBRA|nr:uncharacterized protein K450DRAFT_217274 [Umbelopsis ramanniana AG]KAI8584645.1 hypothetical protein K450DRAFT_217274 [Umbelopsis ramanniana AG]